MIFVSECLVSLKNKHHCITIKMHKRHLEESDANVNVNQGNQPKRAHVEQQEEKRPDVPRVHHPGVEGYGVSTRRIKGKIVTRILKYGQEVPERQVPLEIKQEIMDAHMHMTRLEARLAHVTAYESKRSLDSIHVLQSTRTSMIERLTRLRQDTFTCEADKCADDIAVAYLECTKRRQELELEYGHDDIFDADQMALRRVQQYNDQLGSLGTSDEAALAVRNFLFSDRPWSDVDTVVVAPMPLEEKALRAYERVLRPPTSIWNDPDFVTPNAVTRELAARQTSRANVMVRAREAACTHLEILVLTHDASAPSLSTSASAKKPKIKYAMRRVEVPFCATDTVRQLREKIVPEGHIKPEANEVYGMTLSHRLLDDDRPISFYNIRSTTGTLILKHRPGTKKELAAVAKAKKNPPTIPDGLSASDRDQLLMQMLPLIV